MAGAENSELSAGTSLTVAENVELIRLPGGRHKYMNPTYKRVQQKMYDYTCDVRLKVGNETFQAHKEVLSEASDYFDAMFSVDMLEKDQDLIEIHEISPKGFSSLLEYFYHGHITITSEIVEDIIEAARFFQVDWLLDAVSDFLVKHFSLENYDDVLNLCDKYVLGDLRNQIFHYIGQNYQSLSKEGQLENLKFELFHQLLSGDYYLDASEDYVLNTVMKWLALDETERAEYVVPLMNCIKFYLVDVDILENLPEFIKKHDEVKAMIDKAMEYINDIPSQCLADREVTSVRGSKLTVALIPADEMVECAQFKVHGEPGLLSQKMDVHLLETNLECAGVSTLGNFLFVVGGYTHNYVSSSATYRYDPASISWLRLSDINDPRVSFGLCSGLESLFAAGGVEHIHVEGAEHESFLSSVEQYIPRINQWITLPSLPYNCYNLALTSVNDKVFASGGVTDNPEEMIPINYVLAYSAGDEVWTPKAPMLIGRKDHAMVSLNNKIFVFGGSCALTEVTYGDSFDNEVYDIETDQWTAIRQAHPDFGHIGNTSVVIENRFIYLIASSFGSHFLLYYDSEDDSFSEREYCGTHAQKIAPLQIGLPREFHTLPTDISES